MNNIELGMAHIRMFHCNFLTSIPEYCIFLIWIFGCQSCDADHSCRKYCVHHIECARAEILKSSPHSSNSKPDECVIRTTIHDLLISFALQNNKNRNQNTLQLQCQSKLDKQTHQTNYRSTEHYNTYCNVVEKNVRPDIILAKTSNFGASNNDLCIVLFSTPVFYRPIQHNSSISKLMIAPTTT